MDIITPQKVKELREKTQAGFMDCQKALKETNGDIDKAIDWLREKGISKASKKQSAIAADGITDVSSRKNESLIIEINTQTDFVAKNDEFKKLVDKIIDLIYKFKKTEKEEVLKLKSDIDGKTIELLCLEATAKIGEKIDFRRANLFTSNNDQTIGIYLHNNKKISAMVLIDGKVDENVAKDVAMHIAAMNPKFLNKSNVDKNWLDVEKKILIEKTINEGKPKEFAEKIVNGRLNKIYSDVCLEDQIFFKNQDITVGQYVSSNGGKLNKFVRYELGEGIEKQECDFAKEVQSQMKK